MLLAAAGVSIDATAHQLLIFNPATGAQTGLVNIPNTDADTDVVVSPDGTLAYVAVNVERQIYVVDLATNTLATGVNPIAAVTNAQDLAITPDGKFLVTVSASLSTANTPIIVIDTTTRQVVTNLNEGIGPSAVETTSQGDVLVTSVGTGRSRRYTINATGQLTYTGQTTTNGGQNILAAPNGLTAIQTDGNNNHVTSLLISGMSQVQTITLPLGDFGAFTQSMAFSPDGTRFYAMTESRLLGYGYNPVTGAIGSQFLNFALSRAPSFLQGVDQFDVSLDGSKIYLASGNLVQVLDASNGTILGNINVPNAQFIGLDVGGQLPPASGPGTVTGTKYNDLNGNGVRDASEPGLANWVIYVDLDNDSTRDAGEPFTTTDGSGNYSFTLDAGSYSIREEQQAGWVQTSPTIPMSGGNRLFALRGTSGGTAQIYELGPTGAVVNSFAAPGTVPLIGPQGLAVGPSSLFYVQGTDFGTHTLYELNPNTGAIIDSDVLPFSDEIAGLSYLNGRLYVESHPQNKMLVFDPTSDTVVSTMTISADIIGGSTGAADLGLLFESNNSGQIFAINPATGTIAYTLTPGVGPLDGGLAYLNGELIASRFTTSPIAYRINPTTGAVLGSFAIGGTGFLAALGGDGVLGVPTAHLVAVTSGQVHAGRNFGNHSIVGTITGTKFHDVDRDGVRDAGEPGLAGWVIYVDVNNDGIRNAGEAFATTAADGSYSLPVNEGNYTLREEPQAGWVQTSPQPGLFAIGNNFSNTNALVSINPTTGVATVVGSLGAASSFAGAFTPDGTFWTVINSYDSSLARLAKVNLANGSVTTVGGPLWTGSPLVALEADAAGNLFGADYNGGFFSVNKTTGAFTFIDNLRFGGLKDLAFDINGNLWGISNVDLYRINPANGQSTPGPTIWGTNGSIISIMVDPLSGVFYAATVSGPPKLYTVNTTTGVATEVSPSLGIAAVGGGDFMPLTVNRGVLVSVVAGQTAAGRDFGNEPDQGTITGTKFNDLDGDGVRDGNEPGLPGWTIYADVDNDNIRDAGEPFATTGADGSYSLTVPSGAYTIREEAQAGWVQTSPQPGLFMTGQDGRVLYEVQPQTGTSTAVGAFGSTVSLTYSGAFTPDGTFWTIINSFDSDHAQLAKVNLSTGIATPVGNTAWTGSPVMALEADAAGNLYGASLNGLYLSINKTTGALTVLGSMYMNGIRDLTFDNDGNLWAVNGTQLYRVNPANGLVQPGPQISGVDNYVQSIMVDPLTGVFYATVYSASNPKLYTIDVTTGVATAVGAGLGLYYPSGGDFMPLSANRGYRTTVSAGHTVSGRDFGNQVDAGTVTGTKFNDLNGDGQRDAGEPGLPGWVIYADLDNDAVRDAGEPFTTTAADGSYALTVASGSYVIREEAQSGWVQTSPQPELFVTSSDGHYLYEVDPATGTSIPVGSFGVGIHGSYAGAFTPDGTFWTIINEFDSSLSQLAKVNRATGVATPVGSPNWTGAPMVALEADAAGNLLGLDYSGTLFSINKTTGQGTPIGSTGTSYATDLTFDNDGVLWGVSYTGLFRINPTNGLSVPGPQITGAEAVVQGIMVDPLTGVCYALTYSPNSKLYTLDLVTGVATPASAELQLYYPNAGDFMPLSLNRGHAVTVTPGHVAANRNFGNVADVSTITGTKFNDLDGDGTRDVGEPGLPGWVIYADLDNDSTRDANEPFTTTTADGSYSLTLASGSYIVREEPQAGWVQTSPLPGLFATGGGTRLVAIDRTSGVGTNVGSFGSQFAATYAGAFTPDGTFWTITNSFDSVLSQLATVNLSTGAITLVGSPAWSGAPIIALEADTAGNLLGADVNGGFFSVNKTTGQFTLIGSMGVSGVKDLTFDNNGTLWAVNGNRLYRVNPLTGSTTIGPMIIDNVAGIQSEIQGLMVDPLTGTMYGATFYPDSHLYTINTGTGEATEVGTGTGTSFLNGGDFMPLAVNRGRTVVTSPGESIVGQDFGNRTGAFGSVAPAITAFDLTITYVENGVPLQLDNNAGITDSDTTNFGGAVLTASLISNEENADRLSIRTFAPVSVAGNQILYNGTPIATFTGGTSGSSALVITFQPGTTNTMVRDVLRNLTFSNISDAPSTTQRTVQVQLSDGHGGTSVPVTKLINLTAVNDKPVIENFVATATYTEGGPAVLIADAATVVDADSANFDTGKLTVKIAANSQSTDRVSIRQQGTDPGQISTTGTSVTYGGTVIGTFTSTTTLTVTLNASATPAAVQALLRNVTFSRLPGATNPVPRTISATVTDGDGGTSLAVTTDVNVATVNDLPVIGAFDTAITYTENAIPLLLDSNATVTDADLLDFAGGVLTVDFTANGHADDRLAIRPQGNAAGQIGIVGSQVYYGGTLIGGFTGGTAGNDPLKVTFNSSALAAAVQAVVRDLTYNNVSDNPTTAPRTVRLQLTDGDGGSAVPVTKTINVTAVNDAPVITDFANAIQVVYTEDAVTPTLLSSGVTVADLDSTNFDLGRLTVRILTNVQTTDKLAIRNEGTAAGQIGVSGTSVTYGGVAIGTFTATTTVTVNLNANASSPAVQALLRNIYFYSTSQAPVDLVRTVTATLTDGDGGTSATVNTTVQVIPVNDAPVLTKPGNAPTYNEGGLAVIVASTVTVADPDSPDFDGGSLTVSLPVGATASDWLEIKHIGTDPGQIGLNGNTVQYGGIAIGTFSGGGGGSNLVINFNGTNATVAAVQALMRSITFRVAGSLSENSTRTVRFSLNDGDGGVSADLDKLINVRNL